MSKQGTVTINGQEYDAVSGLPLTSGQRIVQPAEQPKAAPVAVNRAAMTSPAGQLHAKTQRSTTLNRKFTKRPATNRTTIVPRQTKPFSDRATTDVSPHVRKFAPHPAMAVRTTDIGPAPHPHVAKAHARSAAKAEQRIHVSHTPAANIKKAAVTKAIANTHKQTEPHKPSFWQKRQRVAGVVAATFSLVLLGGYFTYLNMPSISVRVAAAQAGIDAGYPNYRPDGYALSGPVTYSDGRVSMNFKANGSNAAFTVNQSKSSWSSDAVLDNYVTPRAGSSYVPYTERGLTIYTYNDNAAWVNGGVLYTIEGDAPLSGEQIRRIATSLL